MSKHGDLVDDPKRFLADMVLTDLADVIFAPNSARSVAQANAELYARQALKRLSESEVDDPEMAGVAYRIKDLATDLTNKCLDEPNWKLREYSNLQEVQDKALNILSQVIYMLAAVDRKIQHDHIDLIEVLAMKLAEMENQKDRDGMSIRMDHKIIANLQVDREIIIKAWEKSTGKKWKRDTLKGTQQPFRKGLTPKDELGVAVDEIPIRRAKSAETKTDGGTTSIADYTGLPNAKKKKKARKKKNAK